MKKTSKKPVLSLTTLFALLIMWGSDSLGFTGLAVIAGCVLFVIIIALTRFIKDWEEMIVNSDF